MQNTSAAAVAIWGMTVRSAAGLCASVAAEDTDEPRRRVSFGASRIRVVVNGTIALE